MIMVMSLDTDRDLVRLQSKIIDIKKESRRMKKFINADVVELNVTETAFGPINPDKVDADKYAVLDENGNIKGWEELYGEKNTSAGQN